MHLLVNAPAYLEKPHECLSGFEVRTTEADWPLWKTETLGVSFSAGRCYLQISADSQPGATGIDSVSSSISAVQ